MFDFKKTMDSVLHKTHTEAAAIALEHHKNVQENEAKLVIDKLNKDKKELFSQIGEKYHAMLSEGNFQNDAVSDLVKGVDDIDGQISEHSSKLEEIKQKFEQDLAAIKAGMTGVKKHNCPKCQKEFSVGVDLFCAECGEDLRNVQPEEPECPSCGESYDPSAAKFCRKCGAKLAAAPSEENAPNA